MVALPNGTTVRLDEEIDLSKHPLHIGFTDKKGAIATKLTWTPEILISNVQCVISNCISDYVPLFPITNY